MTRTPDHGSPVTPSGAFSERHDDPVGSPAPPSMVGAVPGSGAPGMGRGKKRRGRGGREGGERAMVPPADFTSYYGRPIVKATPWEHEIPLYLFLGGVAGGSSLLGAGADLTGRASLRRSARLGAFVAITASFLALVRDLGRPERFHHMLRVFKPTSPMSVGTWILTAYGPAAGLAAGAELRPWLPGFLGRGPIGKLLGLAARPAGLAAAGVAPAVASYTAVLLSNTSTPTWHGAKDHLPYVFVSSASAASGGLGLLTAPVAEAAPARRLAVAGALAEVAIAAKMERDMGLLAEPLHEGTPGRLMRTSRALTLGGAALAVVGRRSRVLSAAAGLALLGGSACLRFGVFEAGQESARDPRYTVVPQRERVDGARPAAPEDAAARGAAGA